MDFRENMAEDQLIWRSTIKTCWSKSCSRTSSDRACHRYCGKPDWGKGRGRIRGQRGRGKRVKGWKMVTTTNSEEMGQQGTTKSFRGSFWVSRVVVSFCGACFDKKQTGNRSLHLMMFLIPGVSFTLLVLMYFSLVQENPHETKNNTRG